MKSASVQALQTARKPRLPIQAKSRGIDDAEWALVRHLAGGGTVASFADRNSMTQGRANDLKQRVIRKVGAHSEAHCWMVIGQWLCVEVAPVAEPSVARWELN